MPRAIAFLELSGFYAGVARRACGVAGPLLVGRRGRLIEASSGLAGLGLRAGMSRREAAYAAPDAQWVEYRPERFRPAAEVFWRLCAGLTPRVEPLADHEAFLDLTGTAGLSPTTLDGLVADLRRELACGSDLQLRAGLAANRLVARLAAGQAPPKGCVTVPPGGEEAFLGPLPASALWILPEDVRETLARLGLHTVAEVRAVPEPALRRLFGPTAFLLLRLVRGRDDSPVPLFSPALTAWAGASPRLGRQVDFLPPPTHWAELEEHLRAAARSLAADLRESRQSCLRLYFRLELADGKARSARHTPREPLAAEEALAGALVQTVSRLLASAGPSNPPHRLVVEAEPAIAAAQLPLPASPSLESRPDALNEALAAVNRSFAAEVLFPAVRLEPSRRERLRRLIPGFGYAAP